MPSHDLRRHDKKKPSNYAGFKVFLIRYERPIADELAERTGLEPATSGVTGQHSNQLNYRSAFDFRVRLVAFAEPRILLASPRVMATAMASPRGFEPRSPP